MNPRLVRSPLARYLSVAALLLVAGGLLAAGRPLGEHFDETQRAQMGEVFEARKAEILGKRRSAHRSPRSRGGVLETSAQ